MPISILNFITVLVIYRKKPSFIKVISDFFMEAAIRGDVNSNISHRTLWNTFLIKKDGYRFGKENETISSALGRNQIKNTLSIIGWILVYILWVIDVKYWGKGGHCINSIKT